MKGLRIVITNTLLLSALAWGHGEDKKGPHGGFIRMPGAFHTEIVETDTAFAVYLLDIEFRNPTVADSSVTVTVKSGEQEASLQCVQKPDHFLCAKSPSWKTPREIGVVAQRNNMRGGKVTYPYPLRRIQYK